MSEGWVAQIFGLELHGNFPASWITGAVDASHPTPAVRAHVVPAEELEELWRAERAQRLVNWRFDDGSTLLSIDRHPDLGYRMCAHRQGVHVVSADGSRVWSCPAGADDWVWQRYLIGQVLPLASVLNGLEPLHTSAVEIHGNAVAFAGPSGRGKTSLGLNLVLRGARFLTDDVAATTVVDGQPMIHSGPCVANLDKGEDLLMGSRRDLLGQPLGFDETGVRLRLRGRTARPSPLRALYFFARGGDYPALRFDELHNVPYATFLQYCFTPFHSSPARMLNQLETLTAIADRVRLFQLSVPATMSASELSGHVESHARDHLD
ncbi:MAG TPA: hypothetical protein VIH85_04825 [Solirubrobacteraceae bacterium]